MKYDIEIDNRDDIIDSRDVIEKLEQLEDSIEECKENIDEIEEEIKTLEDDDEEDNSDEIEKLKDKLSGLESELEDLETEFNELDDFSDNFQGCCDWEHGVPLIRETYIDRYLKEELADCGYIPEDFPSWIEIDWDATFDNMKQDYTEGDFNGITYYAQSS